MKPALFNTEMVKALLDGRKSVTRRVVKPQPKMQLSYICGGNGYGKWNYPPPNCVEQSGWDEKYRRIDGLTAEDNAMFWTPPFHAGDILYVRETWDNEPVSPGGHTRLSGVYYYKADGDLRPEGWRGNWHPSIHMPKEAARIFLRVTGVWVERLQDITVDGALSEGTSGVELPPICQKDVSYPDSFPKGFDMWDGDRQEDWIQSTARARYIGWCDYADRLLKKFGNIWDSTIPKAKLPVYGWDANPWVWVIEFERISAEEARSENKL